MTDESIAPVFIALVEVTPLEGCQLSPSDVGGAVVRCYVAADSHDDAMEQIRLALREYRFELADVEWCVDESAVEWENPDDETAAAMILEARSSDAVVFGEFHTWPAGSEEGSDPVE